jgi:hypothetical protein
MSDTIGAMLRSITLVLLVAACKGDNTQVPDAADPIDVIDAPDVDAPPDADPLATLQGTGLCMDAGCMTIDPSVFEYVPEFELWADGATKRRWIQLPAGTKIDTTNMDRWVFPVGTKLWKEFTRDGVRVETRFITKREADDEAPQAWFFVSYAWNATQDLATATSMAVTDANGTLHDIPGRAQCKDCHDSLRPSRVLGFQAIQLDFNSSLLDLEDLIAMDLLTTPPVGGAAGNRFPIPGNATERAAFGYMHGNCGHCHNPSSPTHDVTPIDLLLDTTKLATVAETPTVLTTVGVTGMTIVENGEQYDTVVIPGNAEDSILIVRMNVDSTRRMPKIASEVTDPTGQDVLRAWIGGL